MEHMKNNILFETEYWRAILADNQYGLGRGILDIKRDVGSLRDLNSEEWNDLHAIMKKIEHALIKAFGAEMFNWSCLMNHAYKREIKKPHPHVHFHFRGRYKNPVEFAGVTFNDEEFGAHYNLNKDTRVSQEVFDKIKEEILKNVDI
jgi:diadenosine tetraphosphate (Ap4A) HIT family hydrolase